MKLFISYSRLDEEAVKALTRGLEAARLNVWRDHELQGGDNWWSVILERIRSCSVFLFALSDASINRSKPCKAELEYAIALRRPIVPIQVGPVSSMRAMPLAELQIVHYSPDDATTGFAVFSAVQQAAARLAPLPQPLPPAPPIPYGYLLALSRKIDVGGLTLDEQMRIINDLRQALIDEDEDAVRADILRMLDEMRRKPWTVVRADQEISRILASNEDVRQRENTASPAVTGAAERRNIPPPGWYPDPTRRHEWRWFDGDWTPWASDRGVTVQDPL